MCKSTHRTDSTYSIPSSTLNSISMMAFLDFWTHHKPIDTLIHSVHNVSDPYHIWNQSLYSISSIDCIWLSNLNFNLWTQINMSFWNMCVLSLTPSSNTLHFYIRILNYSIHLHCLWSWDNSILYFSDSHYYSDLHPSNLHSLEHLNPPS